MKKIVKYKFIENHGSQKILMPIKSWFNDFAFQKGIPTIWVTIDSNEPNMEFKEFYIAYTGEDLKFLETDLPYRWKFLKTAMNRDEDFVLHLFIHDV